MMNAGEIIALVFGVLGFAAGVLGLLSSRKANQIAARAASEARALGQEPYRERARDVMTHARTAVSEAFSNTEGATRAEESSPREVLESSAESLRDLAQCLEDQAERSALEELADQWRMLAYRTALIHRTQLRFDQALSPGRGDTIRDRSVDVSEAQSRWEETEHAVATADKRAKESLASGSRNDRPPR